MHLSNVNISARIYSIYIHKCNVSDTIFRKIHFKEYQRFTKLHRLPFHKALSCRTVLSMQFIRVDDFDRWIDRDSPYIFKIFLVIPTPRLPIYLECVVDIWKVHRLPFGLDIHLCQLRFQVLWLHLFLINIVLMLVKCGKYPLLLREYQQEITLLRSYWCQVLYLHFTLYNTNLKKFYFNTFSGSNQFCGLPRQQARFR